MDAITFLKKQIEQAIPERFKTVSELAEKAGVNQPNLTELLRGNRKSLKFETAWKIMQALGVELTNSHQTATIRRIGVHSPLESVEGDGLVRIPVYDKAGAGDAVDFFSMTPENFIYVLPQYALANVGAIEVTGDSMEPTIKKGSIVGVVPAPSGFEEGHIYLVRLPHLGLVVKRIVMGKEGKLVLRSDNKEYDPIPFPEEDHEGIVAGKVVWVWQSV